MKKVKQLNNWIIKEKTTRDYTYSEDKNKNYCIFSPTNKFMEDNLSLSQAIEFCKNNLDFVK